MVEWTKPDPANAREGGLRRRLSTTGRMLAGRASGVSGAARAGVIVLLVSAIFVAVLGSIGRDDPAVETVRSPPVSGTDRAVARRAATPAEPRLQVDAWWQPLADGPVQFFAAAPPRTPADLCRRLAEAGYGQARWAMSEVFHGEWECSSTLEGTGPASHAFLIVRGGARDRADRLMLKLTAPGTGDRAALSAKAREAILAFADMNGLLLSSEALDLLRDWRPGRTWTSQGAFTAIAEAGRADIRAIDLDASAALPRPTGEACREPCRETLASLARSVEARRVRAVRHSMVAERESPPRAASGRSDSAETPP